MNPLILFFSTLGLIDSIFWLKQYAMFKKSIAALSEPKPAAKHPHRALIVTPTRNNAKGLLNLYKSLVSQDYKDFTWVIVDDASTDETPAIATKLMSRDSRIRYLRIREGERPLNWSPKVYAIIRGLEEYDDGSYPVLVFLDSDVVFTKPYGLRLLVTRAYTYNRVVSLNPRFKCDSLRCMLVEVVLTTMAHSFFGFHQDKVKWFYGCCWATTRDIYYKIGGHRAFYREVVEDRAIAEKAVRENIVVEVIRAWDIIETTWYPSLRETVNALSRILLPHKLKTKKPKLLAETLALILHYTLPLVNSMLSLVNTITLFPALINYLSQIIAHSKARKINKYPWYAVLAVPLTGLIVPAALLKPLEKTEWKGRKIALTTNTQC